MSLFADIRMLFSKEPFYLILYPTSRCNASCPHCYNYGRRTPAPEELTLVEYEQIARKFKRLKVLTVSGGEPFLRDDLADIVTLFCRHSGVSHISFHTNAFLTRRVLAQVGRVLEENPKAQLIVCISIDAIGAAHSEFRGVRDGYEKLLETIAGLKELKRQYGRLTLVSSTIFSAATSADFGATIMHIRDKIGGVKPSLSFIRGTVRDEDEKNIAIDRYERFQRQFTPKPDPSIRAFSLMALKEALERVTSRLVAENFRRQRQCAPCQAGRKLVVMYENADVFACELMDGRLGNLREEGYDINRLMASPQAAKVRTNIRTPGHCHCTWENILPVNILYSPKHYPEVIKEWYELFFDK